VILPVGRSRSFRAAIDLLTMPRYEGTITLDDRRRLGFAVFGDDRGRAVIWLHGTPGARRQIPEEARVAAEELGVRLIGIDRPGVGDSSRHLYQSVLDFADDIAQVTDRLGVDRFAMIGLSGGGPYVLACAHAMPDRVMAGGILGGVPPAVGDEAPDGGILHLAAMFHPALRRLRYPLSVSLETLVASLRPLASPALTLYAHASPPGDRRLLSRPEFRAMFLDDLLSGTRLGFSAPIHDIVLFGQPWGFSVSDVKVPIRWWHGDADHIVPLAHGQHMVSLLPDAELHVLSGESHLGTLAEAEAILSTLLAAWDARGHP
jgi:pimeloyl-ACP methyl ester carboxylesterase